MSWKNLATVVVCALMASTAWAGPTLDLRNTGLNSSGNWVWELRANPDPTLFQPQTQGTGGSLAIELGLQASLGSILSVTPNPSTIPNATTGSAAAPVEFENPGNIIFGWESAVAVDVDPGPGVNMKPVGIHIGTGANSHQAFLSLGTTFFTAAAGGNGYLIATVTTTGPDSDDATNFVTTSLQVLGSYGGNGAIAQSTGATTSVLFDDFVGAATRVVRDGDANLDGTVDVLDLDALGQNYNLSGKIWSQGDFNRDGTVDILDLDVMGQNYNLSTGSSNTPYTQSGVPGAGSGSAAVPEPASIALAGLALLACAFIARRN